MSCISSNFSSFFLNSLNDPSEFAKYLSNGELKLSSFEDFHAFQGNGGQPVTPHQQQQQQQQLNGSNNTYYNNSNGNSSNNNISTINGGVGGGAASTAGVQNNAEMLAFNGGTPMETNNGYTNAPATPTAQPTTAVAAPHHHHPSAQLHLHPHTHAVAPTQPPPATHQHYVHASSPLQPQTPGTAFHHNHLAAAASSSHHPSLPTTPNSAANTSAYAPPHQRWPAAGATPSTPAAAGSNAGAQHFDGSFEFLKYLRHSNDYTEANEGTGNAAGPSVNSSQQQQQQPTSSLIDLDSSTSQKSRSSRKVAALLSSVSRASNSLDSTTLDVFDHDSKHTIFDLHHMTNSSNSNESSLETLAFPNSHLNASNSNTSSEGAAAGSSDFSLLNSASAPKPLASFIIKDNFDVHPSHKVEEGIFQHMNKLPPKKKENLKQLGVRFTGQMTLSDKSIVVENFIKFCQEYDIKDHRPFLSLNQSGLNKPEQIKFARYLGQGLPTFTLFCIYSNFKNLFCTKRTEIYTKDGYNLPYILDKTKRFLSNTTADLKNMIHQQSNDGLDFATNNNAAATAAANLASAELALHKCIMPRVLENFLIYENFDVHETHRVEDGVCTHITRLPPKKQEMLKQFGIQSNQSVTYYEKYIIIENFIKFCNEYKITDHRPFLDFHESGLPKSEQLKFVRYLGQGLPNLTLNKIYLAFKDIIGLNRIEKMTIDGYNLDMILKKKKKNLYNRMHAAVHRESTETARQAHLDGMSMST